MRNSTRSDTRVADWHDALVRDLLAVSPALVYDPVAGGDMSAAPLLRELRAIRQQIARARMHQESALTQSARQRSQRLLGLARSTRAAALPEKGAALNPAATLARLREMAAAARGAIRSIERNRRYRDVPTAQGAPTLYQAHDVPRSTALRQALKGAQSLAHHLRNLPALPAARATLAREPASHARAELPLSALYERWVYLRLIRAFQQGMAGPPAAHATLGDLELAEAEGAEFHANDRTVRIRFEPWILSREVAIASGHALYRAGAVTHAWRPDTVIQIEEGVRAGIPVVRDVYIIDAKLAASPRDEVWDQVAKYRHIRASTNDERVVRMIALALPSLRPVPLETLQQRFDRLGVAARVLPLLPGDESGAGDESLRRLVAEVLTTTDSDAR